MNECTKLRTNKTQMKLRKTLKKVQKEQRKEAQKKDRSGGKYTENRSTYPKSMTHVHPKMSQQILS